MDTQIVLDKCRSLKNGPLRVEIANGSGWLIVGPPFRDKFEDEELDYLIMLGKIPTHTIYRYLCKIRIGGVLAVEVGDKDGAVVNDIVHFLNRVAGQRAYSYFVDGIKYLFVIRLERR